MFKISFLGSGKQSLTKRSQKVEEVLATFEGLATFHRSLLSGFISGHNCK